MRLLIKSLMSRPRPASKLHPGPEKRIFNALKVNDLPKKMTRTLETLKKISLSKILLLMRHQMGPNPHWHSPKRTRTVIFAKKDPNNKAKARILLQLASMPPLSGKTRTKIRIRKIYSTLSAILISRKIIMPTSISKRAKK